LIVDTSNETSEFPGLFCTQDDDPWYDIHDENGDVTETVQENSDVSKFDNEKSGAVEKTKVTLKDIRLMNWSTLNVPKIIITDAEDPLEELRQSTLQKETVSDVKLRTIYH